MRRSTALVGLTGAIAAFVACSTVVPPFCPNGVSPFDGQTAVPLDVVLVIRTGEALPDDLPPLEGTISLLDVGEGRQVPLRVEVDPPSGELRVIPDEPLRPDAEYQLGAVDWFELDEFPHWWGERDFGRDFAYTSFLTASRPALLEVHRPEEDELVLAFSEPVDLHSLGGAVWARTTRTDGEIVLPVLGRFEGSDHLVRVAFPPDASLIDLGVDGGLAASGLPIEPGVVVLPEEGFPIARFFGEPFCEVSLSAG